MPFIAVIMKRQLTNQMLRKSQLDSPCVSMHLHLNSNQNEISATLLWTGGRLDRAMDCNSIYELLQVLILWIEKNAKTINSELNNSEHDEVVGGLDIWTLDILQSIDIFSEIVPVPSYDYFQRLIIKNF